MAEMNTIGADPDPGYKSCPHCSETFDWNEAFPFFLLTLGNTMRCIVCTRLSFLSPKRSFFYWLVFLGGMASAATLIVFFTVLVPILTMSDTHYTISFGMIFLGVGVGIWTWRFVLKIYNWNTGRFTDDNLKQSILDFGR